jgi:hypothetical protein
LKRDQLMDDAELKEFCYRPGKNLQTAEDIIEGMVKSMDKLIDGKAASGTAQDNSHFVRNARQMLRDRLSAIATARGKAKGPAGVTATVTP